VRRVGRRAWLKVTVAGALGFVSSPAFAGPRARRVPKTLDDLLDEVERVLSPEALAAIYAITDPDELLKFASGVFCALSKRLDKRARAARNAILDAQGVPDWDDQEAFFVTALVRRHRGQPLNVEEQLAPERAASARQRAEDERRNREHARPGERIIIRRDQMDLPDVVTFARNTTDPTSGHDWLTDLAKGMVGSPDYQLVEVYGHAERGERDPQALSEARARWVVDLLVRGGVPASRLLQHGLGAAYPDFNEDHAKRPGRDGRVDFVILKRTYLPP
jgi:outer membrane protein OmpA-like peptidoglycan-associated protein